MIFNHDGVAKLEWIAKPGIAVICLIEIFETGSYDTESNFLFSAQNVKKRGQFSFSTGDQDEGFQPENTGDWKLALLRDQASVKKALIGILVKELGMEDVFEVHELAEDALSTLY